MFKFLKRLGRKKEPVVMVPKASVTLPMQRVATPKRRSGDQVTRSFSPAYVPPRSVETVYAPGYNPLLDPLSPVSPLSPFYSSPTGVAYESTSRSDPDPTPSVDCSPSHSSSYDSTPAYDSSPSYDCSSSGSIDFGSLSSSTDSSGW